MTTSYTPILKLALPVTGELVGTWGDIVNNSITSMVEEAVAGLATINIWAGSPPTNTLTVVDGAASTSRCAILECSGTPGAAAFVVCPTQTKFYIVSNSVAGGYDVTLKTAAGTGIVIPNGKAMLLYCDGTNVVEGASYVETAGGLKSNTSSGVAQITGPSAGSTRTYTFPDADATVLTTNSTITVQQGGTGRTTLTNNALLVGDGTNPVNALSPGGIGEIVVSTGSAWVSGPISSAAVISFSGGTTGLTPSSPTAGAVTLSGTLAAASGGTGITSSGASGNVLRSTGSGWQSAFMAQGFSNMQVFTGSTTWTIPSGINNIRVTVVGGGGGGGGDNPGGSGGTSSLASGTQTISTVSASGGSAGGSTSSGSGGIGSGGDFNFYGSAGSTGTNAQFNTGGQGGASFFGGMTQRQAAGSVYGSGGGAGVYYPGPYFYPGGGGGGGCAIKYINGITPGNTLTITIGSGGAGGTASVAPGAAGASGVVIIEY